MYSLTKLEMDLLDIAYTDGERIRRGELFDYQVESLNHIRYCITYIEKKYPAFSFEYTYFEPMTKVKDYAEVTFIQSGYQIEYKVRLQIKDGKEIYSDNFYDVPFEKDYDKSIEDLLKHRGIHARVYTVFPFLLEEKINSAFELTNHKPPLGRATEIFIKVDTLPDYATLNETADRIEKIFLENNIYSSCLLFYLTNIDSIQNMDILSLDEYVRDRKNVRSIASIAFRAFGVK